MSETIIIAEIGENHCGHMDLCRDMIRMSAEAGADYAKFQLYDAADVADDDPERDWFHRVALDEDKLMQIVSWSREAGIAPLCTPWDRDKAETIRRCGIDDLKIASFHIVDEELLAYGARNFRRVFCSTGMAELEEIDRAVEILSGVGELYLMHCVSEYPTPVERANLAVMETLRGRYPSARIGYSDHTLGIEAAVAAAARGAQVIEKHVTMDKGMEGTDHVLSADPQELRAMVAAIRRTEALIGHAEKKLTEAERSNQYAMRHRFHHGPAWSEERRR